MELTNPVKYKILYYGLYAKFIYLNTLGKLLLLRKQCMLHNKLAARLFLEKTFREDFTQILPIFFREALSGPFTE